MKKNTVTPTSNANKTKFEEKLDRDHVEANSPVLYEIGQEEVQSGDTTHFLRDFRPDTKSRWKSRCPLYGSVIFTFAYDDQDEDIFEIPEIREYVGLINQEWPCWLFYSVRDTQALLPILLASLESISTVRNANTGITQVKYSPKEMLEVLLRWTDCAEAVAQRAPVDRKLLDDHLAEWLLLLLPFESATDGND